MKPCKNIQLFQDQQTPMGIDFLPDQMKPIAQKNSRNQNFDIILNKFFNNGQLTDIQLQQLSQQHKIILEQVKRKVESKTKRPDQFQKMFFKKAFKYAELSFFKKNKKNKSRRMSHFYHYHFDTPAKVLKIPLINFYHPQKKTKPGLCTGQKSFNSSYVKTILKSVTFRKVCLDYHDKFKKECQKERNKKIATFSSSICLMIQRNKQDITKTIRFLQSSKCKIPWSDRDIDDAYKKAAEDLDDYSLEEETMSKQIIMEKAQQLRTDEISQSDQFEQDAYNQNQNCAQNDNFQKIQIYFQSEFNEIQKLEYNDEQKQQNKQMTENDKSQIEFLLFQDQSQSNRQLRVKFDMMDLI